MTNDAPHVRKLLLDQLFKYDDLGNLRVRSVVSGPGQSLTYQYGQNQAGPHAATQVNSDAYQYDPAGNQTAGPARTIRYTSFNLPSRIDQGNEHFDFRYDAFHTRSLMRESTGASTTYVGSLYEKRVHNGKAIHVFYVPGISSLVAQTELNEESGSQATLYLHHDHLGSVQVTTDATGSVASRANYEPFGGAVDPASPPDPTPDALASVRVGFTEQHTDTGLNLINMEGRIYDPKIGRFLTPDPVIQDATLSESLNPYSYAWNNPLKWVDPSGFQDEAPASSTSSDDVSSCGTGCGRQWSLENEAITITGERETPAGVTVTPATTDDNGTVTVPVYGVETPTGLPPETPKWLIVLREKGTPVEQLERNYYEIGRQQEKWDELYYKEWAEWKAKGADVFAQTPFEGFFEAKYGPRPRGVLGRFIDQLFSTSVLAAAGPLMSGEALTARAVAVAPSSRALGRALEASGVARPAESAAHHIVAGSAQGAAAARATLQRLGIGINDAANGVFLRGAEHAGVHTAEYYGAVNRALAGATTRAEAERILQSIGRGLESGSFP